MHQGRQRISSVRVCYEDGSEVVYSGTGTAHVYDTKQQDPYTLKDLPLTLLQVEMRLK